MADGTEKSLTRRSKFVIAGSVAALLAVGVYVRYGGQTVVTPAQCQPALAAAAQLVPLVKGDIAIFRPARTSEDLGSLSFTDAKGAKLTLASFEGRTLLVNFWATWCVPCRAEMPSLDNLQSERGNDGFQVVAINLDTDSTIAKEQAFLDENGIKHLTLYADPNLTLTRQLKSRGLVFGIPTSILVDANGCRLGTADGGAAWDSPDAKALISTAAGKNV